MNPSGERREGKNPFRQRRGMNGEEEEERVGDAVALAEKYMKAGMGHFDQKQYEQAECCYIQASKISADALGPEHASVAAALAELGRCYTESQDKNLDKARDVLAKSLLIRRRGSERGVATTLQTLGNVLTEQGKLSEAKAHYEEALDIGRRVHGDMHPSTGESYESLANILSCLGQHDDATKLYKKALRIKRSCTGEDDEKVANTLFSLGSNLFGQKRYKEALQMYEESLRTFTRARGVDNKHNASVCCNIAATQASAGDVAGALESARESVRIYEVHGRKDEESKKAANLVKHLEEMMLNLCSLQEQGEAVEKTRG